MAAKKPVLNPIELLEEKVLAHEKKEGTMRDVLLAIKRVKQTALAHSYPGHLPPYIGALVKVQRFEDALEIARHGIKLHEDRGNVEGSLRMRNDASEILNMTHDEEGALGMLLAGVKFGKKQAAMQLLAGKHDAACDSIHQTADTLIKLGMLAEAKNLVGKVGTDFAILKKPKFEKQMIKKGREIAELMATA
jgi:hypothetical protein